MKSLKTTFLALALVAGVAGAFATKAANTSSTLDPTYNWTRVSGTTPLPGETNPLNNATIADASDNYGCKGNLQPCATGVNTIPGQPSSTIFLSE